MIENHDLLGGMSQVTSSRIVLSGALNDPTKVAELRKMTPKSAQLVLTAYGSLGAPWDEARKGAEYKGKAALEDHAPRAKEAVEGGVSKEISVRRIHRVPLSSLRPNLWNAELFPDSLNDESLADLRDSVRELQMEPIQATNSGVLVNGERRWRALGLAGHSHCDVEYVGDLSDDEIIDKVLDFMVTTRKPTPKEKTRVYLTLVKRLQDSRGRKQGRPKLSPDGDVLSAKEIRVIAARKAGISSVRQADRLEAIFTRGDRELQDLVNTGAVTLEEAFASIPKLRSREKERGEPTVEARHAIGSGVRPAADPKPAEDTNEGHSQRRPSEATGDATSPSPASRRGKADNTDASTAADPDAKPWGSAPDETVSGPIDAGMMVDVRTVLALFEAPLLHPGMRMDPFNFSLLGDVESKIQDLRHQVKDQRQLLKDIADCLGCDRVDGMLLEAVRALKRAHVSGDG